MIPSRVLGAGVNSLVSLCICGDGAVGLTATGSSATDALVLSSVFNRLTTTAASTGVKLPATEMGADIVIANDGANTLTVYPQSGTIDGSASVTIAAGKRRIFFGFSDSLWISLLGA